MAQCTITKSSTTRQVALSTVGLLMMSGCVSTETPPVTANDPFFAPAMPTIAQPKLVEDGSLFKAGLVNSLYSDVKARRVGDLISVQLRENTNASKSANTATTKDTGANLSPITGLGGNALNLGGQAIQLGIASNNTFAGDAATAQSNSLSGNISVTVIEVLPNQNLVIRGEKWLTLNSGDEYIRLTGIIRPADISPDNEIESNKIANARIQYSGTGSFADAQKQSLVSRFFNSKWWPL
jgi:flagellar L-ring protein precursor FlgH